MKILFISMISIHAVRWIENLKDSPFELYWYDILDRGNLPTTCELTQFYSLKKRKIAYFKGEYFLRKKLPSFYKKIQPFLQTTENEILERIIYEIRPDIIHSFEMQLCSYPILKTMNRHPNIKWIYSCWGSDLYYYQNIKSHRTMIKQVLKRLDYLHTDNLRDYSIAKQLGFSGKHLGVIPGGGGFKLNDIDTKYISLDNRNVILVKGYEHTFGRALNVIKAIEKIIAKLHNYEIIVFGAHQPVVDYIKNNHLPFKAYDRHQLSHKEVMNLMKKSYIYI